MLAAHRAGLKTVILPERNLKDLIDVPKKVRDDLSIVAVSHMDQIIDVALHPHAIEGKSIRQKRSAPHRVTEAKGDEGTVLSDQVA